MDIDRLQSILYDFASQWSQKLALPVRLNPICRELGVVSVARKKLDKAFALLVDAGTRPKIFLNAVPSNEGSHGPPLTPWERFLVAHELGHLVLHRRNIPTPAGPKEYWKTEVLCDSFARRLLIPNCPTNDTWGTSPGRARTCLQATSVLAREARVPWMTAAFRIADHHKRIVFFRMIPTPDGNLKAVCTLAHHRGGRRRIKPQTPVFDALKGVGHDRGIVDLPSEVVAELVSAGRVEEGAASSSGNEIRLALLLQA